MEGRLDSKVERVKGVKEESDAMGGLRLWRCGGGPTTYIPLSLSLLGNLDSN